MSPNEYGRTWPTLTPAIREDLKLMGPPPLIWGEDPDAYEELLARVVAAVRAKDMLELIHARNAVDNQWEQARLRRAMADIITFQAFRFAGDADLGGYPVDDLEPTPLAARARDLVAKGKLGGFNELPADAVARAILESIPRLEHLDLMIMRLERRRDESFRQIWLLRGSYGQTLKRATAQIGDADYRLLDEKPMSDKQAA